VAALAPLRSLFDARLAQPRFTASVLAFFGTATLLLAMLAVYGTVSWSAQQRSHEMGIRMALGAGRRHVNQLVIGEGMATAGAGLCLGVLATLPAMRLLRGVLYGVEPFQLQIVAVVMLLLLAAVAIACWLPARRAARTDPTVSLRWSP
jgi:ABC-type antimicrobial peptide transport system permease subunit